VAALLTFTRYSAQSFYSFHSVLLFRDDSLAFRSSSTWLLEFILASFWFTNCRAWQRELSEDRLACNGRISLLLSYLCFIFHFHIFRDQKASASWQHDTQRCLLGKRTCPGTESTIGFSMLRALLLMGSWRIGGIEKMLFC